MRWQTAHLINIQLAPEDRLAPELMFPMSFDPPKPPAVVAPAETAEARLARIKHLDPEKFK